MVAIKKFKVCDNTFFQVWIGNEQIELELFNNQNQRLGIINWNFRSAEAMASEMAEMVEEAGHTWFWGADGGIAISDKIYDKDGNAFAPMYFSLIKSDVQHWLREQFQKPRLRPESEEIIAEYVKYAPDTDESALRKLCRKVAEVER